MRRTTAVLAVCLCAVTGCRDGVAQERYDGVVVTTRGRPAPTPVTATRAAEPIASEVDVPWTIALLSDAEVRGGSDRGPVTSGDPVVDAEEHDADDVGADLEVVVEYDTADEKPPAAGPPTKSCTGVVKGRS